MNSMRLPTPHESLYRWHKEALEGRKPAVTEEPNAGWYCRRLKSRGRFFPGSIYWIQPVDYETGELVGDEVMKCEISGIPRDPWEEWLWMAKYPISEAEYLSLMSELFVAESYLGPQRTAIRWLEGEPK